MPSIDIFYYSLDKHGFPPDLDSYLCLLDDAERARFNRFKNDHAQKTFLLARKIVKERLSELTGLEPKQHVFEYGETGKPSLKNDKTMHFSIAHCRAAICVSVGDIVHGVDVETHKRRGDPWENSEAFFNSHIADKIKATPKEKKPLVFTRYWTALEAFVKLRGSSLFAERETFLTECCVLDDLTPASFCGTSITSFAIDSQVQFALAVSDHSSSVNYFSFHPAQSWVMSEFPTRLPVQR